MGARSVTSPGRSGWPVVAGLALAVLLPSAPSLGAFFVGDDFDFLARMRSMDAGDVLRLGFWGEWEPLWYLDFYRDFHLFGLAPWGFHLVSLGWLGLCVLGLYLLVRELWPESASAPWAAALLFAAHPLHDEAVTYLAARGHPMALAFSVLALFAYVRSRRAPRGEGRAALWVALAAAFLAALAKETALVLPLWVAALEGLVLSRGRWARATASAVVRAALLFGFAALLYFAARHLAVGLGSEKLGGPEGGASEALASLVVDAPAYALIGGVPLPFAFFDRETIEALWPLGWLVLAAVGLPLGAIAWREWCRAGELGVGTGLAIFGLVVAASALAPPCWADLGLRRRYFFMPSLGTALVAVAVLEPLGAKRPRTVRVMVAALCLAGAAGLAWRNELYRQAGHVTRSFFEAVSEPGREPRRVGLLTLPRYLGGDELSGAYVLHPTDARSAIRLAGGPPAEFSAALECAFAEDYAAEAKLDDQRGEVVLRVSFASSRAFRDAVGRTSEGDRTGDLLRAAGRRVDEAARTIEYQILLAPGFLAGPSDELYAYEGGRFRRLGAAP